MHTQQFAAMGTQATVTVIDGDPDTVDKARQLLAHLEDRWSRFRADSDVTALNANAGSATRVAPETLLLVERALAAASATEGRYDPTVGAAVIAHGYDRTFTEVAPAAAALKPRAVVDGSWPAIDVDRAAGTVCLAQGTVFDAGGIGKGLAADLVIDALAPAVGGLLVNLGGDLRAEGIAPDPAGWVISIEDPFDNCRELGRLAIPAGAAATSSTRKRRWTTTAGPAHHLIDPRTGRPAETGVATVTTVAAQGWWAEAGATSLLLLGASGMDRVPETLQAVMVLNDGSIRCTEAFKDIFG